MALTLPSPEDLDAFSQGETDVFTEEQKDATILQASDLLFIATGIDTNPTDVRTARIVNYAILAMAWKLLVLTDNTTEVNSPFQHETIGSYSYSKMMSAVSQSLMTGVSWFDIAVKMLLGSDGVVWSSSEKVFPQPYSQTTVTTLTLPDFFGG